MPTIWQRPDSGRWYVVWREHGRLHRTLCRNKSHARDLLRDVQLKTALVKSGLRDIHASRQGAQLEFGTWAQEFLDGPAKALSPSAQRHYEALIRLHLGPILGTVKLANIDALMVQDLTTALHRGRSAVMVNRNLSLLKTLLRRARDAGYLSRVPKIARLKEVPERPRRAYADREVRAILKHTTGDLRLMVQMALGTGIRRGALLRLLWADVDLRRRTVRVEKGKGGKTRTIPLPQALVATLRAQKKAAGGDRVFRWTDFPERPWRAALKAAGLPLTFHELRHTYTTRLLQEGVDVRTVRDLVGHTSIVTTERYTHASVDRGRAGVDRLGSHLFPASQKPRKSPTNRR